MSYFRSKEDQRRLENIYKNRTGRYGSVYYNEEKGRLIRYSFSDSSKYKKYLQRQASRAVRRDSDLHQGMQYKKLYDIVWELY